MYFDKLGFQIHKIPSLPICRKDLLNSSRLRQRLQVDGYKFFAKLPAAGPDSAKILNGIRRSRCIKFVKNFEFDPYLCDHSQINRLRRICHPIKDLTHLNLVIRRVDSSNEIESLSPFIARFLRIKSLRIEFPCTQNTEENNFVRLYRAIGKCTNLRSFERKAIGMTEETLRSALAFDNCLHRLKRLEKLKIYEALQKGAIKNNDCAEITPKARKIHARNIDMTFSSVGEWGSKGIEKDIQMENFATLAQKVPQVERVRFQIIKTAVNYEDVLEFFEICALIPSLIHIEYELLNSQISDMEIGAIVHGLIKAPKFKYFSLKVIQKPGISEDCIEKFACVLSRLDNLSRFDIYFRKLGFHPQSIKDLGARIDSLENIQCSCSKESIHIFRKSDSK